MFLWDLIKAKKSRKSGAYTKGTLWMFRRLWIRYRSANGLLEYCAFRRDLGYPLHENRARMLQVFLPRLGRKNRRLAQRLLSEWKSDYPPGEPKALLHMVHDKQVMWRSAFVKQLESCRKQKICIVGNSSNMIGAQQGSQIDASGAVIRFNRCWKEEQGNDDSGRRLDVWVSAPDVRETPPGDPQFVIVSGPEVLYRSAYWERFETSVGRGVMVLTVPLSVWREQVARLHAPPSAGVLILAWLRTLFGGWEDLRITGFDLEMAAHPYHHADPKHVPGSRHNWPGEKELLRMWIAEGLEVL